MKTPFKTVSSVGVTLWALSAATMPWSGMEPASSGSVRLEWLSPEVDRGFSSGTGKLGVVTAIGQATLPLPSGSVAALVSDLKEKSGLTAEQLGRLMGVSRRSIHNWAAGASISATREERVRQLGLLVFGLPADTPEERRALLLDSSTGASLFRQFADADTLHQQIQFPIPVDERLGL